MDLWPLVVDLQSEIFVRYQERDKTEDWKQRPLLDRVILDGHFFVSKQKQLNKYALSIQTFSDNT